MAERPRALVTGASRGIGRSIALRLAGEGYDVAGCYAAESEMSRRTRAEVEGRGACAFFGPCDVGDADAVDEFVQAAERALGPLTALVSNAGIVRDRPMVLMSLEDWQSVVQANLTGTWNVCRSMAFRFLKRRCGAIVTMSSVAGIQGNAAQSNYAATKAGIIGMSKSLAKEVAPYGIRVNVVAPGFIETDMVQGIPEKVREKLLSQIPLKRFGTVEEVGRAVVYIVSSDGDYITGAELSINGGLLM